MVTRSGRTDFMVTNMADIARQVQDGALRLLAVGDDGGSPLFPDVPTLREAANSAWTKGVWRGMVGPKGLPGDIAKRYETLFKKIHDSDGFKAFMAERGFEVLWADAAGFATFMKNDDVEIGKTMKIMGLTK